MVVVCWWFWNLLDLRLGEWVGVLFGVFKLFLMFFFELVWGLLMIFVVEVCFFVGWFDVLDGEVEMCLFDWEFVVCVCGWEVFVWLEFVLFEVGGLEVGCEFVVVGVSRWGEELFFLFIVSFWEMLLNLFMRWLMVERLLSVVRWISLILRRIWGLVECCILVKYLLMIWYMVKIVCRLSLLLKFCNLEVLFGL